MSTDPEHFRETRMTDDATDRIARAICREKCAFLGEPPCWDRTYFPGEPWPNPDCDEPGCMALATAAAAAIRTPEDSEGA